MKNFYDYTSKSRNVLPKHFQGLWLMILLIAIPFASIADNLIKAPKSSSAGNKIPFAKKMVAPGDFSLDFVASAPYTYNHATGGGAFDDRTIGKNLDVVESLEGGDFKCGDIVTYLTKITVASGAIGVQNIELDYSFLANTTGQAGAAHSEIVGVSINNANVIYGADGTTIIGEGPGGSDSGNNEIGSTPSTATLDVAGGTLTGPLYQPGSKLIGTVTVDGLEAGETVIVRVDVRISCDPGSSPTGNLQGAIPGARLKSPGTGTINVGNQTVPFKKIGELVFPSCSITPRDPVCEGATTTHTATSDVAGATFAWTITGNGTIVGGTPGKTIVSSTTTSSVDVVAGAAGSYTLAVTISKTGYGTTNCDVTVTVTDNPDLVTGPIAVCENGTTGGATVNLASGVTDADGGTLTYHATEAHAIAGTNPIDASQTVAAGPAFTFWVRSTSTTNSDCFGIASIAVTVTDNPDITTQPIAVCENGATGTATISLASGLVSGDGGTVTYHATEAHAIAGTNAISASQSVNTGNATFWVRSTSTTNTSCFSIASIGVTVTDNPDVAANNVILCEGESIDLTTLIAQADGGTISFHTSQAAANAGTGGITTTTVTLAIGTHTYYVRSTNGDCYGTTSLTVTVNPCSKITLQKLTNGTIDNTKSWTFALYEGADGFDSDPQVVVAQQTTNAGNNSLLFNSGVVLSASKTYTLCELGAGAGWSQNWMIDTDGDGDGDIAVNLADIYNPDADNIPSEDLGNRCIEIGAGTSYPLPTNVYSNPQAFPFVLSFVVDNTYPQGNARTPGYWKNWNTCTNGKQQYTALKNGGSAAGFWLLDNHLPITLHNGTTTCSSFILTQCDAAVKILSTQDVSGRNKASDAAYNLSKHLLAYLLNKASDSYNCAAAATAANEAQTLLASICFNGTGDYLGSKVKGTLAEKRTEALRLAAILDAYNNNMLCGSTTSAASRKSPSTDDLFVAGSDTKLSAYPNPYTDKATIEFSLKDGGEYALVLHDVKGSVVKRISAGKAEAGKNYSFTVDGNMPEGIYIARLSTDRFNKTIRVSLRR